MDPRDFDALLGAVWLFVIGEWLWTKARARREKRRNNRRAHHGDEPRVHARYICAPTGKEKILVGLRKQ
jgi:hypothetical protein